MSAERRTHFIEYCALYPVYCLLFRLAAALAEFCRAGVYCSTATCPCISGRSGRLNGLCGLCGAGSRLVVIRLGSSCLACKELANEIGRAGISAVGELGLSRGSAVRAVYSLFNIAEMLDNKRKERRRKHCVHKSAEECGEILRVYGVDYSERNPYKKVYYHYNVKNSSPCRLHNK